MEHKIIEGDNYDLAIQYFKMKQEGKEVIAEYYEEEDGWTKIIHPSFDEEYIHRLLIPKENKYVPYTYEDGIVGMKVNVKFNNIEDRAIITRQNDKCIWLGASVITYQELLDNCTKPDGTPCGKEIE